MESKGQVTFVELALDFEAYTGRALPAAPSMTLRGEVMSLHERARVLRVALATLQKHVRQGVMLEGEMTTKANSLIPLGAGLMVGLTARPYFTRRQEMTVQLAALGDYSEGRLMANLRGRRAVRRAGADPLPGGAPPQGTWWGPP